MHGGNMAIINPYIFANRQGIPRLEATGVSVNTTNVVYSFKNHPFLNGNFAGLIIFKLPAFTAPTTAVPIVFDTNGKSVNVTTLNGATEKKDITLVVNEIVVAVDVIAVINV